MKDWDAIYKEQGVIQKEPMKFITDNVKLLKENDIDRILDLGCGTGRHLTLLHDEGFQVHGVDASPKAIELLTQVLAERGVDDAELKVASFTQIPYLEEYFDAVACINVIQHGRIHDIGKATAEIARVTRVGGLLLLTTLSTKDGACGLGEELEPGTFITGVEPDGTIPHHFFTEEELRDLFRGFEVISLKEKSRKPSLRKIKDGVHWELLGRRKA